MRLSTEHKPALGAIHDGVRSGPDPVPGDAAGRRSAVGDEAALWRRLLALMSHDLCSPVTSLIAAGHLLEQSPESTGRFASRIRQQAGTTLRRIQSLMTLIEADHLLPDRMVPLDLAFVAEGAIAQVRDQYPDRSIDLAASLDESSAWVTADGALLEQAVRGLLDFAVNQRPAGAMVNLSLQCRDGLAGFAISLDTGPIAEDGDFWPFADFAAWLDGTQDSDAALALMLARTVAVRHGGCLTVEQGGGSRESVILALPALRDDVNVSDG